MVEVSCSWKTHFDKGKSKPYVFIDSTIAHHSATSSRGHFMNFMKPKKFAGRKFVTFEILPTKKTEKNTSMFIVVSG